MFFRWIWRPTSPVWPPRIQWQIKLQATILHQSKRDRPAMRQQRVDSSAAARPMMNATTEKHGNDQTLLIALMQGNNNKNDENDIKTWQSLGLNYPASNSLRYCWWFYHLLSCPVPAGNTHYFTHIGGDAAPTAAMILPTASFISASLNCLGRNFSITAIFFFCGKICTSLLLIDVQRIPALFFSFSAKLLFGGFINFAAGTGFSFAFDDPRL